MGLLKDTYERRKKYVKNLDKYLLEIGKFLKSKVENFEIYVYGSILSDEFSIGLSDVDIAIVSDEFEDRDKKLEIFGELTKMFIDAPFEFHVLSREQWEIYKRFIRTFKVVKN